MDKNISISFDSSERFTEETSIVNLIPCDYDSSEEDNYANSSQDSIDSSELVDDSDGEVELITEVYEINKKLDKIDEKEINEKSIRA